MTTQTWGAEQWERWANGDGDDVSPPWQVRRGLTWRAIGGAIAVAAVAVVYALLPGRLAGELPDPELTHQRAPRCPSCPLSARISGVGLLENADGRFVNVRFAAVPVNTRLRLEFPGIPGTVSIDEQSGNGWRATASAEVARRLPLSGFRAARRGELIVVELPDGSEIDGVAATDASGDRVPDQGFVAARGVPPRHFNIVDALILVIALAAAWGGYRRGHLLGALDFAGLIIVLLLTWLFYRPLGSLALAALGPGRASNAVAFGVLVAVLGLAAYLMAAGTGPIIVRGAYRLFDRAFAGRVNAPAGVFFGVVRAATLAAMILALGMDLAVFAWADRSVTTSLAGPALIQAWRGFFPGV